MVTVNAFKKLVLALPGSSEHQHFEKRSYKVKEKIFATLDETSKIACFKFSPADQSAFCSYDQSVVYPVPNKWGKSGWTNINLQKVKKEMLEDAVITAYILVAPKTLSKPYSDARKDL